MAGKEPFIIAFDKKNVLELTENCIRTERFYFGFLCFEQLLFYLFISLLLFDTFILHHSHLEKFENTQVVIRYRKSRKDRQYNGKRKTDKRTNNDLQNISQKIKDRAKRTPLKSVVKSGAPEG